MKLLPILFLCFSLTFSFAQKEHNGVILDSETQEPLEFVNIFNHSDYTVSNVDGRFSFSSSNDSVNFYRVGYDKLETTLNQLKDSVFLDKSIFELNEVVVTNAKTIYQKIKDSITQNYLLEPHTETFFLRTILKKNGAIVRLQDIQGNLNRKTSVYTGSLSLEKKDFEVEILNMRKIGVSKDENDIYFTFPSLHNIFKEFVRLNAMGPNFEVTEQPYKDEAYTKVDFKSNLPETSGRGFGHYMISNKDHAILSFNASIIPYHSSEKTSTKRVSRVLENTTAIFFKEDPSKGLYFMNSAKRNSKLEVKGENNSFTDIFEMSIVLITSNSFGNAKIKSNTNEQKDIFKLKHPYNQSYWRSQNQLLLTEEMQAFIKKMGTANKEFKVRSNMD
jgi:hypothetical protein